MIQLPDISKWNPRQDKQEAISNTFLQTCQSIEARLIAESQIEKRFNIDNYDSGIGIEDLFKREIGLLLPSRYEITSGVISDKKGLTCGDCDIVILNKQWFPLIKYGATNESRRVHIPVESVYSVIEIKQSLTKESLEKAMEKIVTYKRLDRIRSEYGRIVENHNLAGLEKPDNSLNYRYDSILMVNSNEKDRSDLIKHFFRINELLAPEDRVNSLGVLGYAFACYTTPIEGVGHKEKLYPSNESGNYKPYILETETDVFYRFWVNLWKHLSLTVLNGDKIFEGYAANAFRKGKPLDLK
ncbi:DUF6602 domain-containing protein [Carboxylicivirga linearis]|uniref:DUF6602 domain-containing protein n=1 Tax=Carboxylicivirga linearis TaxID=1628157 RepID=A0ABS5K413_9BACT|nr:DUF6602 domain-containing protein [Carboxylicivirga linearis]MBS2101229.1 hypothetical protein [Carboxylicivirga linearis]